MTKKKKLMVVLGAGASIDLGMPSVSDVDDLFHEWSLERYKSVDGENRSLYSYIRDKINLYYSRIGSTEKTNYEEVLYAFLQLSFVQSGKSPMGAFLDLKEELADIMDKCFFPEKKEKKVNFDVP